MKNSKKKKLRQMERQDSLGISRRKQSWLNISLRTYKIIKICLIIAIPVVYFLCSPFLIIVMLGWIALLVLTSSLEKKYNAGLKKELHVRLPKTDSILCILIVVLAIVCTIVSSVSIGSHASVFHGMTDDEVSSSVGGNFDSANFVLMNIFRKLKEIGALQTGTRWLFLSERSFMGGGGGDVSAPPSGGADISDMLSNMPFSMVFQSIIKACCSLLLVIVCVLGIVSLFRFKKLGLEEEGKLTEKERLRRRKRAEKKRKKNYHSAQKADYEKLERELLEDLAFLFGDNGEETGDLTEDDLSPNDEEDGGDDGDDGGPLDIDNV